MGNLRGSNQGQPPGSFFVFLGKQWFHQPRKSRSKCGVGLANESAESMSKFEVSVTDPVGDAVE